MLHKKTTLALFLIALLGASVVIFTQTFASNASTSASQLSAVGLSVSQVGLSDASSTAKTPDIVITPPASIVVPAEPAIPEDTKLHSQATSSTGVAQKSTEKQEQKEKPEQEPSVLIAAKEVSRASAVPVFSQFKDISSAKWKKIGCGIASLTMLIDYYKPGETTVDDLLDEGIASDAYIADAGWSHQGLVNLAKDHGLSGTTHDLSGESMTDAFEKFERAVQAGPAIASVHYTFKPTNPIPHLVVITGIKDDTVYYNDPAAGSGSISATTFKNSWKQRYIVIRPAA